MKTPEAYLIEGLSLFHIDPPDSDYQEGYFDALAYMADYFNVIKIDADPERPSRPNLILIKGGKE